jgi:hypothetical protein
VSAIRSGEREHYWGAHGISTSVLVAIGYAIASGFDRTPTEYFLVAAGLALTSGVCLVLDRVDQRWRINRRWRPFLAGFVVCSLAFAVPISLDHEIEAGNRLLAVLMSGCLGALGIGLRDRMRARRGE